MKVVDRIIATKRRDPEADTSELEREIDHLMYALYELTPEEIQIVEGADKWRRPAERLCESMMTR